jgi:type II secretory pathway component PulF
MQTLSYATGPRRREMPFTVLHMTIWLSIVTLTFLYVGCRVVPKFDLIFSDFHTELPPLTKWVLRLSRWCRNDFGWIVLLLLPAVPKAFDRWTGDRWERDGVSRRTRILFGLFMLMAVLAFCLVIVGIFSPMLVSSGGVSSPKAAFH